MALIGIDIGTTNCKIGLFAENGSLLHTLNWPTPYERARDGRSTIDPGALWQSVAAGLRAVVMKNPEAKVLAVGIASMAESGLLIDRRTGAVLSPVIPWFDPSAAAQAEKLFQDSSAEEHFGRTGIRPSYKSSLAKILWLRDEGCTIQDGAVWLPVAGLIASELTGVLRIDATLACRTAAFQIEPRTWDTAWLGQLGLPEDLFPQISPSGTTSGRVNAKANRETGLSIGTPVIIAGHDHVVASLAAGSGDLEAILDSMGTAEVLIGGLAERKINHNDYESGLMFGCHVIPRRLYWMGSLSAAGGSIDWLRGILGDPQLSIAQFEALANSVSPEPGEATYFPFLNGRSSIQPDAGPRGAFTGLSARLRRVDLVNAVLEGTAFEVESMRQAGERITGKAIRTITAAGRSTRSEPWMQKKADISGCRYEVMEMAEAALSGAAILGGVGAGIFTDAVSAAASWVRPAGRVFIPDPGRHERYRKKYEEIYLPTQKFLQEGLRSHSE